MTASVETWKSYAQLLARLSPRVSHILFASADGTSWWSSDPSSVSQVQYALSLLLRSHTLRHSEVDGLMETEDSAESRYGFRIRGALGEVLGLVVIALPQPEARMDLGAVHALIKLALDCLQSELSARAAIGKLHENLADSSRDLFDNPRSQSMVVAITKLAHTFGMETVAGHVETDAIRARVAQLGVDYGQGFFIGKPLALDDAIQDLPLYSCFATSTGLFDGSMVQAAAQGS